jgi:hypothetical protein
MRFRGCHVGSVAVRYLGVGPEVYLGARFRIQRALFRQSGARKGHWFSNCLPLGVAFVECLLVDSVAIVEMLEVKYCQWQGALIV